MTITYINSDTVISCSYTTLPDSTRCRGRDHPHSPDVHPKLLSPGSACTVCTHMNADGRRGSRRAQPSQREGQGFESP